MTARRMVEEAGFADVSVADMPTKLGLQFVPWREARGGRPCRGSRRDASSSWRAAG